MATTSELSRRRDNWNQARTALRAAVGLDEIALLLALALVTAGLWMLVDRAAFIVPGLVLLWIALPARVPLIASFRTSSTGSVLEPSKKGRPLC